MRLSAAFIFPDINDHGAKNPLTSTIRSVCAEAKILNIPVAPNPTVKWRLRIWPTAKFDDATSGCAAPFGQKVKYPA